MKILDIIFSSVVMCISSLPLIVLILIFQRTAVVPPNPPLDQAQISEVQQLLIDHDPRQLLASDYQEVRLSETEFNALVTYIKNSNPDLKTVNIHADLVTDGISLAMSIPVRALGMFRYLNLNFLFKLQEDTLALEQVDAGALSLPSLVLTPIRQAIAGQLNQDSNFQLASSFMKSLHFQSVNEERLVILLDWQQDNLTQLEDQARQVFVSDRESQRLQFYHDKLVETLDAIPSGAGTIRLNDLLRPMFLFASISSVGSASPAAENRAVFIVLSAYLTDLELSQLIGGDVILATPRKMKVVIENREDLVRHVVSSAAISASAGATMAEVLSVYKEVHDSRYRTGFSFTDIAANQAGALLGTLASRSEQDARLFQDLMKNSVADSDFLPTLGTYDGMTEQEFIDLYGNRESESYRQRLSDITDSIIALPFYQAFAQ